MFYSLSHKMHRYNILTTFTKSITKIKVTKCYKKYVKSSETALHFVKFRTRLKL